LRLANTAKLRRHAATTILTATKTASIDGRTDRRPTQEELRKPIRPRHLRRCDL